MENPISQPVSIRAQNEKGLGFAIEFNWVNDRFANSIFLLDGSKSEKILTSVEGDSESEWPPSPTLQQVSIEEINGEPIAFGVGMSGTSHWSASFFIDNGESPKLIGDIACRAKHKPERLGSEYDLEHAFSEEASRLKLVCNGTKWATNDNLLFAPEQAQLVTGTIQWKYEIAFQ